MKALESIGTRELRLIFGGGVLLVAAAVASFLVVPQVKAWRSAVESRALLARIPPQGELSQEFALLETEIADLRKHLVGDTGDLPVQEVEAYIVGRLQGISWGHDVELLSVAPGERQQIQGFHELSFDVQVTGGYLDLYSWLDTIDQELGFVVVKELRMSILKRDPDDPDLRAALTVASYRRTQP